MKDRTLVQTSLLGIANNALSLVRKRIFTKSPVRENRTPGSVRGLPGNWQSYRAQLSLDANDGNAQFLPNLAGAVVDTQQLQKSPEEAHGGQSSQLIFGSDRG